MSSGSDNGSETDAPDTQPLPEDPQPEPPTDAALTPEPVAPPATPTQGDDTIIGTSEPETIDVVDGNNFVDARGGGDLILGRAGDDTLLGGRGDDRIGGELGNDSLSGQQGRDDISGGEGNDTITGGGGDDSLSGDGGNDLLVGNGGADRIVGDAGLDTLIGGNGDDLLSDYDIPFNGTLLNTSVMDGGAGNDTLQFDDGSTVTGGAGEDSLFLYDDFGDTLVSRITDFDPSEDILRVAVNVQNGHIGGDFSLQERDDGTGNDLFLGEELIAEIQSTSSFALDDIELVVVLKESAGDVSYTGGADDTDIEGNYRNNTIIGGDGDERILVGEFASLNSQGGANNVDGGAGNDTITGVGATFFTTDVDDGNETFITLEQDTLNGGAGDDVLISRNGNILTGGDGADVFALREDGGTNTAGDTRVAPSVITDFNPDEDAIVIDTSTASGPDPLTIVPFADGSGATIEKGDQIIAQVTGGQDLTVEDLVIEPYFRNLALR